MKLASLPQAARLFLWLSFSIWNVLGSNKVEITGIDLSSTTISLNSIQRIGSFKVLNANAPSSITYQLIAGFGDTDNHRFEIKNSELWPRQFMLSDVTQGTTLFIRVRAQATSDSSSAFEKIFRLETKLAQPPSSVRVDVKSVNLLSLPGDLIAKIFVLDPDVTDEHQIELNPGLGDSHNQLLRVQGNQLFLAQSIPNSPTLGSLQFRLKVVDSAGLTWVQNLELPFLAPKLRITEISASTSGGIKDEAGNLQPWVEIQNLEEHYVDLNDWKLSDSSDGARQFELFAAQLGPQATQIVIADGLTVPPINGRLARTNLPLDNDGGVVTLLSLNPIQIHHSLRYRESYPGTTYGLSKGGIVGYLRPPSPGNPNDTEALFGKNSVIFSETRGLKTAPFKLTLEPSLPGSTVLYTIDGTSPAPGQGITYREPIQITASTNVRSRGVTIIRALAIHPLAAYAPVETHTYLFIDGVLGQDIDSVKAQSTMVSSIIRDLKYGSQIPAALKSLPSLSVVLIGNPAQTEKPASIELIDHTEAEPGFQIDCGLEATGTTSLSSPKLSMGVKFKSIYGQSRLNYPIFNRGSFVPGKAAETFQSLRVRSHSHDTFYWLGTRENPPVGFGSPPVQRSGDAQLVRNPWIDEMQLLMGQPGKRGRQVHLYLNGNYRGIYHIHEHPDEDFMASYFPGSKEDFHFSGAATTGSIHGSNDRWQTTWSRLKGSLSNYSQAKRWIDVTNLCDYMILSFYSGNDWDWSSQHNWGAAGPKLADRGGWKFFQQDSDIILQDVNADSTDQSVPDGIFNTLMTHSDFRTLFRDRVQLHCFGSGALTPSVASTLYNARMTEIQVAIIAESARWQPQSSIAALPWDRDQEWMNEWNYMRNTFFPNRTTRLIEQFRRRGNWWSIDPPGMNHQGGRVPNGFAVGFIPTQGTLYFTTDGSDPRLPGGSVSPTARIATPGQTVQITTATTIRARMARTTDWSAIIESYFIPDAIPTANSTNFILSEIHYHPRDDQGSEFLEFVNVSTNLLSLDGVSIQGAVAYNFPKGTILNSLERIVVTKNLNPTNFIIGTTPTNLRIFGPWEGNLNNAGETIEVVGADKAPLLRITYGPDGQWPELADGGGSSLELKFPLKTIQDLESLPANLDLPHHWIASVSVNGTPGNPPVLRPLDIVINEVVPASFLVRSDSVEILNRSASAQTLANYFLSDALDNLKKYPLSRIVLFPGDWLVLTEADFNRTDASPTSEPFGLDNRSDLVILSKSDSTGEIVQIIDWVRYLRPIQGGSYSRQPDGIGSFQWLSLDSLGRINPRVSMTFEAWISSFFPFNQNSNTTGESADPDGDQVDNRTEFLLETDPTQADNPLKFRRSTIFGGNLQIVFQERRNPRRRTMIDSSSDLVHWETIPPSIVLERLDEDFQEFSTTTLTLRLPNEIAKAFFRLRSVPAP